MDGRLRWRRSLARHLRCVEISALFFYGSCRVAHEDSRVVDAAIEVVREEEVAGNRRIVLGWEGDVY
jgi:hypothetical protein